MAVLAVYAIVLQAILGAAAMSASLVSASLVGGAGHGIICRGDASQADARQDGARQEPGRSCACQGLCPEHEGGGIDPARHVAQLLSPSRLGRLAEPEAILLPAPAGARKSSFARAPPRLGRASD
ncbi:MAG: hypothetical protein ACHQAQ_01640 [Hyphomicrobiales bacterium]